MTEGDQNRGEKDVQSELVVVDCAGAVKGGAARFLGELQTFLDGADSPNVELIGLGKQLTPQWILQRELIAKSAKRRISLNNASFMNPIGQNITLLRNILQFATQADLDSLGYEPPLRLRTQTPVVKALARLSDGLIVPCTRMFKKVEAVSPSLKDKLVVRFHPVSRPKWAGTKPGSRRDILLPVVPSPYKNLDQHIQEFLNASEALSGDAVRLVVPSTVDVLPEFASHPRVEYIGPQTSEDLSRWWRDSQAVFFPTEFESFGYALAEARVYGRSVIAQDTMQNREIAGHALHPYDRGDLHSLRFAIGSALKSLPEPDPEPFDPSSYFNWLLTDWHN